MRLQSLTGRMESSIGFLGFFESLPNGGYAERVVAEVTGALRETWRPDSPRSH